MQYFTCLVCYLHQHTEEGLFVLSPECGQLLRGWEQTAASVNCDLRTVAKVHTEVLGGHGETRWLTYRI